MALMDQDSSDDYYETLQISTNADPDMIHRVYRLLAQRYHPDNQESGNEQRFRKIHEAYSILNDPEKRAQYDIRHEIQRRERWRFAASSTTADNDFEMEQQIRLTVLEVLYTRRRVEPDKPGLSNLDLEQLIGRPREHLEFTMWYLVSKKMVTRGDNSSLIITADGVDYLEQSQQVKQRLRLTEKA
jgi:curved DNA-binding protein CbpA